MGIYNTILIKKSSEVEILRFFYVLKFGIVNYSIYLYNMENEKEMPIYPFNEQVIDAMVKQIPNLAIGITHPMDKEKKITYIYDRIVMFNKKELIDNYNLFFEGIIATLN